MSLIGFIRPLQAPNLVGQTAVSDERRPVELSAGWTGESHANIDVYHARVASAIRDTDGVGGATVTVASDPVNLKVVGSA